jgi:hypothetical protein
VSDIADPVEPKWDDNPPIIHEQPETWVYWNPHDQLVIRQRHGVYCDCEEPFLFLSIENVQRLIAALQMKLRRRPAGTPGRAHPASATQRRGAQASLKTAARRSRTMSRTA